MNDLVLQKIAKYLPGVPHIMIKKVHSHVYKDDNPGLGLIFETYLIPISEFYGKNGVFLYFSHNNTFPDKYLTGGNDSEYPLSGNLLSKGILITEMYDITALWMVQNCLWSDEELCRVENIADFLINRMPGRFRKVRDWIQHQYPWYPPRVVPAYDSPAPCKSSFQRNVDIHYEEHPLDQQY